MLSFAATKALKASCFSGIARLIEPATPDVQREVIELEATYSKRSSTLPWRDLPDETQWLQGRE